MSTKKIDQSVASLIEQLDKWAESQVIVKKNLKETLVHDDHSSPRNKNGDPVSYSHAQERMYYSRVHCDND